jgi:hypothetical protein
MFALGFRCFAGGDSLSLNRAEREVKTTVRNPLESEGNNILRGGAAAHDVCGDVHIASIGSILQTSAAACSPQSLIS